MDIMALLRFVDQHNEKIFAVVVVLFLATSILLLVRQIGQKAESHEASDTPSTSTDAPIAKIDVAAIEGAMKRVLATQTGVAVAAASGSANPELASLLQTKEERIQELQSELEKMKDELSNMPVQAASSSDGGAANPNAELQTKIEELQARLAEYEIIEDDIADLSMYKDENARLKQEVEELRARAASAPASVASSEDLAAQVAAPRAEAKTEQFAIDPNDAVMKEFAAAVEVQKAPPTEASMKIEVEEPVIDPLANIDALLNDAAAQLPPLEDEAMAAQAPEAVASAPAAETEESVLEGALDTEKMLSEVETLGASAVIEDESALDATLDTDKLLQEVSGLEGAGAPESNEPLPNFLNDNRDVDPSAAEDDLLAEFKDKSGS